MRLAEFTLANREPILGEWEEFARTCAPAGGSMDVTALRDHANQMLTVIAADLATRQSAREQAEKSKGQSDDSGSRTAAAEHGAGRARSGFTVEQMVAEYRALRASVIRLWMKDHAALDPRDIDDLTRFNEAIDQSLAESVHQFSSSVDHAKETFLAILGHDMRTPLGAISSSAMFMLQEGQLDDSQRTLASRIVGSAKRTIGMVGDLLDFTRSRLGGGIPVARQQVELDKVVQDVVNELSAMHPDCPIIVRSAAPQAGRWDAARLSQALGNLIGNAVQHGESATPVTVDIGEDSEGALVRVHNAGTAIPPEELDGIFNPMKPRATQRPPSRSGPTGSLGLGLYIAEQIVSAHGGHISVTSSSAAGTTFTVHLPRDEPKAVAK
jgi:signal transduction histidine kinase